MMMSRSNPNHSTTKATQASEPYQAVPAGTRQWVGKDKALLDVSIQEPDRYSYDRWKASRKLGMPEWELADEPDDDRYNLKEKENTS